MISGRMVLKLIGRSRETDEEKRVKASLFPYLLFSATQIFGILAIVKQKAGKKCVKDMVL